MSYDIVLSEPGSGYNIFLGDYGGGLSIFADEATASVTGLDPLFFSYLYPAFISVVVGAEDPVVVITSGSIFGPHWQSG